LSFRTKVALLIVGASAGGATGSARAHDGLAAKLEGQPQTVATSVTADGRTISLVAQDSDKGICLTIPGVTDGRGSCSPPPPFAELDAAGAQLGYELVSQPTPTTYLFGVVSAATASLQVQLRGGGTQTLTTTDGGYVGRYRGKSRFYLGAVPGDHRPYYVRALGPDGKVLSASEDQAVVRPSKGPIRVARGRVGGRRFSFSAELKRLLAPLPGQPERRATELCIRLDRSPAAPVGGSEAATSCNRLGGAGGLDGAYSEYRPGPHCSNSGLFMWGTVKAATARVSLRLSGGATIQARTIDLRRRLGLSRRVFALAGPSGGARPVELDALSDSGRRTDSFRFPSVRIPASRSGCSAVFGFFGEFSGKLG
jgi:hypothetical protein